MKDNVFVSNEEDQIFSKSNSKLLNLLPTGQVEKVFLQGEIDIDDTFLGFVHIYDYLSQIIPQHFTVIDLGCAYNPQCFFFTKHKQYIAIDWSDCVKFQSNNCIIYQKSIQDFINDDSEKFDKEETFVICAYAGREYTKLIGEKFCNIFTFYPSFKELQRKQRENLKLRGNNVKKT